MANLRKYREHWYQRIPPIHPGMLIFMLSMLGAGGWALTEATKISCKVSAPILIVCALGLIVISVISWNNFDESDSYD